MAGKDMSVFVNIGGKVMPSLAGAINTAQGKLNALSRSMKDHAAAQKAAIRGMMDSFKGMASFAAAGGLAFSVKKFFGDGEELAHEIQGLRNAGRTAHELAEGIAAANNSIRKMPTASLTGSIKLLNETTGAFGDYHHALENLDFNSKLSAVLKNTSGSADPEHDIGTLIKALEIRGSAANPEQYRREAGELQRAMTFYKGGFKADEFRTFATNAPVGIRQLDERFLTKIAPSLIQEMGGDKAGTGLTAFRTIISGRKITDRKQAEAWQKLGLLNKGGIIKNKMGDVTGWKEGSVKGTRLAYQDPLKYMETVILPRLQKSGTDIADPIKLGAALNTLFKNTKANAFVTAISTVIDRTRLKKDEALINKVLELDANYDDSLLNDPKLAQFAIAQAMKNLGSSLTLPLMKPIAQGLISIAAAANKLSAALIAHPEAAKIVASLGGALATMAAIRIASFVFGVSGLARAIALLMIAAPIGAAGRLIGVAKGIGALSVAASVGLVARVRALGVGIAAVTAIGGGRMALGFLAGSIGKLGKSVLLFPLNTLRAVGIAIWGLAANPIGIAITAIVVALTALGTWVANNWSGLKSFATAFGETFSKSLGPGPAAAVNGLVDGLKGVWDRFSKILGPLDESGVKWVEWGAGAGRGAAAVVTALSSLPAKFGEFGKKALDGILSIDWTSAGSAIVDGIVAGISAGASRIGDAIKGGVSSAGSAIGGAASGAWNGIKSGASALKSKVFGPSIPGRYAGGPVRAGMPYIVGEHGPEIFVPSSHGSIKTNGFLNGMNGGPTVDASAVSRTRTLANETGMVLHRTLDATRTPIVDTSSIDEAAIKVASLGSALSGLGGSFGGGGGGGGRGGGGSGDMGGPLAIGKGAGIGHIASKEERAAYIKEAAKRLGIDGKVALRVAQSEGFNKYVGDYGTSFGDFQLHTGGRGPRGMRVGGLGDLAMRQGINIHDPKTWKAQTDFALSQAKKGGWGPWHGWRGSRWAGIDRRRATGGPVGGGLPYLVGERGPEVFTPGESGRIASNREIARLTDPSAVARLRSGAGASISQVRGDTHYTPAFTINGASNPAETKRQVESHFWDMVRRAESEQRGLLSD